MQARIAEAWSNIGGIRDGIRSHLTLGECRA